jgi:hypothetical protein
MEGTRINTSTSILKPQASDVIHGIWPRQSYRRKLISQPQASELKPCGVDPPFLEVCH